MKKLCIASNMLNERPQLESWLEVVQPIADGGVFVVDGGSTDGTKEFLEENDVLVIADDIIQREGYGPARTHLRAMAREHFPEAHWLLFLDADERIDSDEYHRLRYLKDYLIDDFDAIAFPRIDWMDEDRQAAAKDWRAFPDWQCRMTRLGSSLIYVRKLHEQVHGCKQIYNVLSNPKIHHFHRIASQEKRNFIGCICAILHEKDAEWGHTYPKHHKEDYYLKLSKERGLI